MKRQQSRLVQWIVGKAKPWPTGCERIATLRDAILWRIASLPGLDAEVRPDGSVRLFERGPINWDEIAALLYERNDR